MMSLFNYSMRQLLHASWDKYFILMGMSDSFEKGRECQAASRAVAGLAGLFTTYDFRLLLYFSSESARFS